MNDTTSGEASVVSINVGLPAEMLHKGKSVTTGISKLPVSRPLYLDTLNFEGDGQADLQHHGGPDKAVCVYPTEHYPYWKQAHGRAFGPGAFGENLTTRGLLESDTCIGDVFRLGEAIVQVTQPRQPCFKLSVKYDWPKLPLLVQQTGFTGYYFRVLKSGNVNPGAALVLQERMSDAASISYANRMMHEDKQNREGMERLLRIPALSASWRKTFLKRLDGGEIQDTAARLQGPASN
jgi:MOSC domain-containing protein YiiM